MQALKVLPSLDRNRQAELQDEHGLQLNSINWLVDHHRTKELERRQMVEDLGLPRGARVLDLGCGPGFWAPMIAEKVGPSGRVVGLDGSEELLRYAAQSVFSTRFAEQIAFRQGDFCALPFEDASFDFVFFGNCLMYVREPERVIAEIRRVTRPGGRVAAKDFDGSVFVLYPMDVELSQRVLAATAHGLSSHPPEPYFDNYSARRLHGLFVKNGFKDIVTRPYPIQKVAPLVSEAERYIRANADWYIETASPHLTESDIRGWRAHFDESSADFMLRREDFYFCMLEVMTCGTV